MLFKLAELKQVFDRFAVSNEITATEASQALTESGIIVPRRYTLYIVPIFGRKSKATDNIYF